MKKSHCEANKLLKNNYTNETFLIPSTILRLLQVEDKNYTDLTEYKELIQFVLTNVGPYQLSDKDKSYYIKNFNTLLESNSFSMINNTANYKTLRSMAKEIYLLDEDALASNKETCKSKIKYMEVYKNIIFL